MLCCVFACLLSCPVMCLLVSCLVLYCTLCLSCRYRVCVFFYCLLSFAALSCVSSCLVFICVLVLCLVSSWVLYFVSCALRLVLSCFGLRIALRNATFTPNKATLEFVWKFNIGICIEGWFVIYLWWFLFLGRRESEFKHCVSWVCVRDCRSRCAVLSARGRVWCYGNMSSTCWWSRGMGHTCTKRLSFR